MMLSTPTSLPVELMGPMLQGPAEIKTLQAALKNLSVQAQRPDIDPKESDGVVGPGTVQAVIAGLSLMDPILDKHLATWQIVALKAGLAVGAMTSQAKTAIATVAGPLTVAANTAAVKFKKDTIIPGQGAIVGFFAPGWYKTPLGMGLIAAAAFIGWKLFFSTPSKA